MGSRQDLFNQEFFGRTIAQCFGKKDLYVSLYGTTSIQQIEDGLYRQLHPILSSRAGMLVGQVAKGALKKDIDIGQGLSIRDYFDIPKECLLLFDDLERCLVSITHALGYINHFVEHRDCKVILLANEEDILAREENIMDTKNEQHNREEAFLTGKSSSYSKIKEKLVGQTLTVNSTARSAIKNFLDLIKDDKTRKFLNHNADEILLLHSQSRTNNLRLLKHSLWDFERLARCFSERHWANDGQLSP
jgi:hypothetical protein